MTDFKVSTRDELVEFATFLYGSEWRDQLAEKLQLDRRNLVLTLAANEPISPEISLVVLRLVEERLDELRREHTKIYRRIDERRRQIVEKPKSLFQPKAYSRMAN